MGLKTDIFSPAFCCFLLSFALWQLELCISLFTVPSLATQSLKFPFTVC